MSILAIIIALATISQDVDALTSRSGGYPKFPLACGRRGVPWRPEREPRVIGGEEPPYGAIPWQVELRHEGEHRCGGALISTRLVLTAAHCYIEDLVVIAGGHGPQRSPFEQIIPVQTALQHPDFRKLGPYSHDIAVLLLQSPVGLSHLVQPACFGYDEESPPPGTWCEVSGWGASDPRTPDRLSPVLRSAAVPLLSLETCRRDGVYGGRQQQILDSMLCAGHLKGGIDACGGDSGGPLVCERDGRLELTGIVSWGDGCAKKDRPGVYTRVSSFLPWIRECAKEMGVDYYEF